MRLYGVGIGPGEPDLLTLRAVNRIREADLVVVPYSSREMTLGAVRDLIAGKEYLLFNLPIRGKKEEYEKLLRRIREYDRVAYVVLGDPAFYSSFYYLASLHPPEEVVPGITSFSWCSALNKTPIVMGIETALIAPVSSGLSLCPKVDVKVLLKGDTENPLFKCGSGYFTTSVVRQGKQG